MKFRVYDNVDKKYIDLNDVYLKGDGFLYTICWGFQEDEKLCESRYTVEFSTGLKDKNGVEIYEGDIIKDVYSQINPIKFHYGSFRFNWLEMPYYLEQIEKGEIIGNIHGGNDDK